MTAELTGAEIDVTHRTIISFDGEFRFLSNFAPSPIEFVGEAADRLVYPTVEHAYQAAKSASMVDRRAIAAANTPGEAKRMGRCVVMHPNWEQVKVQVMHECLRLKFMDPDLHDRLRATGLGLLVEGNHWHDNFWGVCYCASCPGVGVNALGRLLMHRRAGR